MIQHDSTIFKFGNPSRKQEWQMRLCLALQYAVSMWRMWRCWIWLRHSKTSLRLCQHPSGCSTPRDLGFPQTRPLLTLPALF
jgi:hypothetical protein